MKNNNDDSRICGGCKKRKDKCDCGRPLKFKSVKKLQEQIDDYFKNTPEEEWTITGLCLALDTYRDVLIRYTDKSDRFYNTIKRAKEKVHNAYEKDLRKKGRSGDIFALKNFGWRDERKIDHTTGGDKLFLTDEQKERLAKEILEN